MIFQCQSMNQYKVLTMLPIILVTSIGIVTPLNA